MGVGAVQRVRTMRGSLAIFLPGPTERTSTTMSHEQNIENQQKIEEESVSEQEDSQYGVNNIGYLGAINMFPLHVETLAGGEQCS